jgi:sodium pump decarboxylase gamma subunit
MAATTIILLTGVRMVIKGVLITVMGMGIVFIFLGALILLMKGMTFSLNMLEKLNRKNSSKKLFRGKSTDEHIVAAIAAGIYHYPKNQTEEKS